MSRELKLEAKKQKKELRAKQKDHEEKELAKKRRHVD